MTKEPWVGTLGRGAVVSRVLVSQNYDSRITTRPTRTLDEPNADSKHKELVILPKKKAWFTCDLLSVPFLFYLFTRRQNEVAFAAGDPASHRAGHFREPHNTRLQCSEADARIEGTFTAPGIVAAACDRRAACSTKA